MRIEGSCVELTTWELSSFSTVSSIKKALERRTLHGSWSMLEGARSCLPADCLSPPAHMARGGYPGTVQCVGDISQRSRASTRSQSTRIGLDASPPRIAGYNRHAENILHQIQQTPQEPRNTYQSHNTILCCPSPLPCLGEPFTGASGVFAGVLL